MMRPLLVAALLCACATTAGAAARAAEAPRPPGGLREIDAAFEDVLARYRLPGLALGVIENGKIVYTRTAGEQVAGEGAPIDARTLFKIASNTKAMTAATLARLVDAGKLRWDDPVIKHLPQFRMHDPWVTRHMQVRDLLIHNSGLPAGAGDLMLWPEPNAFTRADVIAGLRHLQPRHSFRANYDYDNLLYIVAGEVAAAAGGASFETLVRREVLAPLGMARCQVGQWSPAAVGNVAQPHMRKGGRNVPVRRDGKVIAATTQAAAGGVRCSLDDMLTWASVWLQPDDAAVKWLSPAQRAAMWTPQMPMPVTARMRSWDNTHFSAYGYGWRMADVDGVFKVSHTGTLMGMYSAVTLLPDQRTGFVILMNGEGDEARTVLTEVLVKHYTVGDPALTVSHYAGLIERQQAQTPPAEHAPALPSRRKVAAAEFASRLGVFRDPWFGEISLCSDGEAVRLRADKSPLLNGVVYEAGKGLLVDWDEESVDVEAWLTFTDAAAPERPALHLSKVDPDADFSFDYEDLAPVRVRDCE